MDDEGLVRRVIELSLRFEKHSNWLQDAYDCLVDLTLPFHAPAEYYSFAAAIDDSPLFLQAVAYLQEALLVSPNSPYAAVYQAVCPKVDNRLTVIRAALKTLKKALPAATTPKNPPTKNGHTPPPAHRRGVRGSGGSSVSKALRSQTSQLSLSGLQDSDSVVKRFQPVRCVTDDCLLQAQHILDQMVSSRKTQSKAVKAAATAAAKWRDKMTSRAEREEKTLLRQRQQTAKMISNTFQQFWKLASSIALRRYRAELRSLLVADRLQKQLAFVHRAERYAARLAHKLDENRRLMPLAEGEDADDLRRPRRRRNRDTKAAGDTATAAGAADEDPEDDEYENSDWSMQEEEDVEFEALMEQQSDEEDEEDDEIARLKEESTMNIDELMRRIRGETPSLGATTEGSIARTSTQPPPLEAASTTETFSVKTNVKEEKSADDGPSSMIEDSAAPAMTTFLKAEVTDTIDRKPLRLDDIAGIQADDQRHPPDSNRRRPTNVKRNRSDDGDGSSVAPQKKSRKRGRQARLRRILEGRAIGTRGGDDSSAEVSSSSSSPLKAAAEGSDGTAAATISQRPRRASSLGIETFIEVEKADDDIVVEMEKSIERKTAVNKLQRQSSPLSLAPMEDDEEELVTPPRRKRGRPRKGSVVEKPAKRMRPAAAARTKRPRPTITATITTPTDEDAQLVTTTTTHDDIVSSLLDEKMTVNSVNEVSPLLRANLRKYQLTGFKWLLNLHDCDINGILADEMGLGKTLQSISILSYLASERGIWGPHLIIVPTSVLLNWEAEFRKFLPGFKVLVYMGTKKERDKKRQGWQTPFLFNVCITSYSIALQDAVMIKRISWYYMILDEAHNLKNAQSQKWQSLLTFNSERRLLLTGTPLQNNLMELWSLLYFLMPHVFGSHEDWDTLFNDPILGAIDKGSGALPDNIGVIKGLYRVIKPFILRRLKKDVENQMPSKVEHVVKCRLTKRQRYIYDEYINLSDQTFGEGAENPSGGGAAPTTTPTNHLAVMNILMQLRKVCNHPDLVEDTQVLAPLYERSLQVQAVFPHWLNLWTFCPINQPLEDLSNGLTKSSMVLFNLGANSALWTETNGADRAVQLSRQSFSLSDGTMSSNSATHITSIVPPDRILLKRRALYSSLDPNTREDTYHAARRRLRGRWHQEDYFNALLISDPWICRQRQLEDEAAELNPCGRMSFGGAVLTTSHRQMWHACEESRWVSPRLIDVVMTELRQSRFKAADLQLQEVSRKSSHSGPSQYLNASTAPYNSRNPDRFHESDMFQPAHWSSICRNYLPTHSDLVFPEVHRASSRFQILRVHKVMPYGPYTELTGPGGYDLYRTCLGTWETLRQQLLYENISDKEWDWKCRSEIILPPASMIEHDSGKLLALTPILMRAKAEGLKVIIFTQMSRMLDILEKYLAYYGLIYVRLSGSTKPEIRQSLVDRFNNDPRILAFIASTRAGGVGINLTSASVVIFYDTDWNPAMDRQAMDRCHRLGQTRDVHIYRFIDEATIEENIWRKQLQKRLLDDVVVDKSRYDSDLLKSDDDVRNLLFTMHSTDDLYATRILHDRTAASDLLLRGDDVSLEGAAAALPAADSKFDEIMAQVEDAEDVVAAKTTQNELVHDIELYREEFGAMTLSTAAGRKATVDDTTTSALEDHLVEQGEVQIHVDDTAGDIWVTPQVARAVRFLEESARTRTMESELHTLISR